jgi:hypothetical protein
MVRDSDGDGIPDVDEVNKYYTDPRSIDTDSDGLTDYQEVFVYYTDPLKPNPNIKYALDLGLEKYIDIIRPLDNDATQDSNERQLVELMANSKRALGVPTLIRYLSVIASDGIITSDELKYSRDLARLAISIYDEVSSFYFIKGERRVYIEDKIGVTDYALNLVLRLSISEKPVSNVTLKAIAYYGVAVKVDNLPEDLEALSLLVRGVQIEKYGSNLVDFDSVVIVDVKGNTILIESYDKARDTWMIAYLLKQRPELVDQPKKFEWINRMVQRLAYDIFDSRFGLNREWIEPTTGKKHLPENLTPTSEKVWSIILGLHDYMDQLPLKMENDGLPVFFPYWNSDLLQENMPDKTNRTVALLQLAALPNTAFNRDTYDYEIGSNAMLLFIKRLPEMYEWIVNAWKNPNSEEYKNAENGYEQWLGDRYIHGLENTVEQFSGIEPVRQEGTIDGFLSKIFPPWKFATFVYAYLRGRAYGPDGKIPNYGEAEMYRYELPLAFIAVGIPAGTPGTDGTIGGFGTSGNLGGPGNYAHSEFTIYGIPQSVIDALLAAQKSLGRVAVGYGNGISMMSAIDGFEKDSGYEIWQRFRETKICLWEKK